MNRIHTIQNFRKLERLKYGFFTTNIRNFSCKYLEDDYEIMGFLGQGSTSRVFLGHNILTNQKVVIKLFKQIPEDKIYREIRINNKISQACNKTYFPQIERHNTTSHLPILRLLDVVRNKGCGSFGFIFEYFPGSPMHLTPITLLKAKRLSIIKQILQGLNILHSTNIVHRDLKPSNILFTTEGAKLFDFGLSKQKGIDELKTNRFGTKCYYTPEVIFRMPQYDEKLDIWTCGLIFSELATLIKPILPYKSDLQTLNQVINFCDFKQDEDEEVIREDFKKFITKNKGKSFKSYMIQLRNSNQCMSEINDHQFQIFTNTIKKMLKINPSLRPSAREVLDDLRPLLYAQR